MNKVFVYAVSSYLSISVLAGAAYSGPNSNVKIAAHLIPHVAKTSPCANPPLLPCNLGESNLSIEGDIGVFYDLYLLVMDGDPITGISGAAFGISYKGTVGSGLDVYQWTPCADVSFGSGGSKAWPDAGSGNVINWDRVDNCQDTSAPGDTDGGVSAVLGALYVYAYGKDTFKITERNFLSGVPTISVVDCQAVVDTLTIGAAGGKVKFGPGGGAFDPCQ